LTKGSRKTIRNKKKGTNKNHYYHLKNKNHKLDLKDKIKSHKKFGKRAKEKKKN
jgi:hypothetical protein